MSDEVREAVDNIIRGTTTNSPEEWMLREYKRMMNREKGLRALLQRKPASDNMECPGVDRGATAS
tara:strand:- start:2527 stop:2721 length:195 start_codon:yes stop_codon:yes gene_type:complete